MMSGFERYYQIARCFRDEAQRADRQLEFTQLDIEMAFVERDEVLDLVEGLYCEIWQEVKGVELPRPFPKITWHESMLRFGSDKPDLRYGLEIADVTDLVRGSEFGVFKGAAESGGVVRAAGVPGRRHVLAQGARRADRLREGVGREGTRVPAARRERRGALADREVPLAGRDRRPPRGHRRRRRRRHLPRGRHRGGRGARARRPAAAPGRQARPLRPRRLRVRVRGRLPALHVGRGGAALRGRAPHVHGPEARARAPARHRSGRGRVRGLRLRLQRSRDRLGLAQNPPRRPAAEDLRRRRLLEGGTPRRGSASCSERCATARRRTAASRPGSTAP